MRDNFSEATKKLLADRAGRKCSNPYCRRTTIGPQLGDKGTVNIGEAAHIYAASPGGKRYADTIEGNCDTTLFLGGKEKTTLKEIAEILGKETIDLYNTSDTRGSQRSYGMNYQKTGKELMSQDEIAVMDGGKCILQVRGVRPFFSNKYDICKHKNYKYLSDYDKKNTFDIEKYLSTNLILKPEDEVELYQM